MDELAKRVAELADKFGPKVAEAMMAAVRVEAWNSLLENGLGVLFCLVGLYGCWRWGTHLFRGPDEELCIIPGILALCILVPLFAFGSELISPWLWTAFFNPEVWIAARVLKI